MFKLLLYTYILYVDIFVIICILWYKTVIHVRRLHVLDHHLASSLH